MKFNGRKLKRYLKAGKKAYIKAKPTLERMGERGERLNKRLNSYFRASNRQLASFKPQTSNIRF